MNCINNYLDDGHLSSVDFFLTFVAEHDRHKGNKNNEQLAKSFEANTTNLN